MAPCTQGNAADYGRREEQHSHQLEEQQYANLRRFNLRAAEQVALRTIQLADAQEKEVR